jgi:acyl-CoA synthetase (AMP-forming)/AMP-acid ligase II
MPLPVVERALALLPQVDFVNAYGLTETSSTIAVLTPNDHRDALASDDPAVRRRLGSVGQPSPSVEISIRDPFGEEVSSGEHGEIWVRGEQVSGEYVGREGGGDWFATRDGGFLDEGGFLFIEGRLDDVIVRGGENISPGEIEEVLREHPAVDDVAVYAIPSQEWGEDIGASVVLVAEVDPDELRSWVRTRLRSTRVPALIDVRAELPYNETGKLLRRVLKAEMGSGTGSSA